MKFKFGMNFFEYLFGEYGTASVFQTKYEKLIL